MSVQEWSRFWVHPQLGVELLQAHYVQHAYPRHSHDYYVICLIERGRQSFTCRGEKHITPAGGVILINPDEAHTGEAVDEQGFHMRAIYPTTAHMQAVVYELAGDRQALPYFKEVRIDHPWAMNSILALHRALVEGTTPLECDSRFTSTLAQLVRRYAEIRLSEPRLGKERQAIARARRYIEDRYAEGIRLEQLAAHVALSPFYLLRTFRAEVGMPPHAYLENVRIRHAQRLIEAGLPLAEVAAEVGFSSQSQLSYHFKKIIGVTPGQYARGN